MSHTSLESFERRLALVAYFRHVFGVEDALDPASVRLFYDSLEQLAEGYTPEGRSYVANVLQGLVRGISLKQLLDTTRTCGGTPSDSTPVAASPSRSSTSRYWPP